MRARAGVGAGAARARARRGHALPHAAAQGSDGSPLLVGGLHGPFFGGKPGVALCVALVLEVGQVQRRVGMPQMPGRTSRGPRSLQLLLASLTCLEGTPAPHSEHHVPTVLEL